jgi:hypothetical protein
MVEAARREPVRPVLGVATPALLQIALDDPLELRIDERAGFGIDGAPRLDAAVANPAPQLGRPPLQRGPAPPRR